ncbi:hypothetical protein LXA43DRAFT_120846 [Ganoderma leucocontextum]|nr:hypothetical protein LXA43DRAFT_120846 [Ganoderma leucocontextum]
MSQEPKDAFPFPEFASSVPATDRASLYGLSKDEIQAWALRKSEEYRLLSYTMLSLHNAAAPIHTLPTEVLMKIFGQTWDRRDARRSLVLPSVCRRWRTVYLSTPEFWAEAVYPLCFNENDHDKYWNLGYSEGMRSPHEFVAAVLNRSFPRLIALRIEQWLRGLVRDPTPPPCVLPSMIFPHLNRVVSLHLETTLLHLHDLYRVLNAGMASLEVLYVHADSPEEMERPDQPLPRTLALPPVSDESLPRLRNLTMMPPIFFPLFAVKSLKKVHLDCVQDMSNEIVPWLHPASSESRSLLRTLSRCCNLELLHLEDITQSRWWPPLGHGSGTVQLPSLKELSFGLAWHAWALAALAALDPCIPSTAAVYFGQFDWDPTMNNLSQLMPSHLVQHHPFDRVVIFLPKSRPRPWVVRCFADQSLRLDIRFDSYLGALTDLGIEDVFRAVCVTHLEIIQGSVKDHGTAVTTQPEENWPVVLRAFPHLTHLTAAGADTPSLVVDALAAISGYAGTANSNVGTSPPPLCPALRYLTLGWEMLREDEEGFGVRNPPDGCDPTTYRHRDVDTHVERRCSAMQPIFEKRARPPTGTCEMYGLELYEYEAQPQAYDSPDEWCGVVEIEELIPSSRRDGDDLPCLARLGTVVGGPVVYRGYLSKVIRRRI